MSDTTNRQIHIFDTRDNPLFASCAKLRHAYFVRERKWIREDRECLGLETDTYDQSAWHLACIDAQGVCAYLRALPGRQSPFMLDHEFSPLLSDEFRHTIRHQEALELSRLVVRPNLSPAKCQGDHHPVEHLLKALYGRALKESYSRFYIVVEEKWPPLFARRFGLSFRVIGTPYTFPDGTRTVAAQATIEELEQGMLRRSETNYQWYRTVEAR